MKAAIKGNYIVINKKKIPLLSGEVHYWRLNPANWKVILEKVIDLGLDIISTYVPWQYHEYEKGKLDFIGETQPQRDLNGFLSLCEDLNLWVIIRPGPYIYSEWKNLGLPDHVADYHRLHPQFIKCAKNYIKEVCHIIRPHLVTNGGKIILLQPDNEIDPFIYKFPEQLGFEGSEGIFQKNLKLKYKDINKLNHAWGDDYSSFKHVMPTVNVTHLSKYNLRRYLDFREFMNWYVQEYAKWVIKEYRRNKIDVPFMLNAYTSFEIQNPVKLADVADVVGLDIYPSPEFTQRPDEHRNFLEWARCTNIIGGLPYIAELETGIWHGCHYRYGNLTSNHYDLMNLSTLAAGVRGWNWYMLVNRDNWYGSPINEWGLVREALYVTFKKIVELYKTLIPPELKKLTEVSATLDENSFHIKTNFTEDILRCLYTSDIDYEFLHLTSGKVKNKLIFYASENWLPKKLQKRLADFVKEGATLVFFENAPLYSEDLEIDNPFKLKLPQGSIGEPVMLFSPTNFLLELGKDRIDVKGPILCYNRLQGKGIYAERTIQEDFLEEGISKKRYLCGCEVKEGKGKILVLSLKPNAQLIKAICRYVGVRIYSNSLTEDVKTALFKSAKGYYLFVLNNANEKKAALIEIDKNIFKKTKRFKDIFHKEKIYVNVNNHTLTVKLERKDATVIELSK